MTQNISIFDKSVEVQYLQIKIDPLFLSFMELFYQIASAILSKIRPKILLKHKYMRHPRIQNVHEIS